MPTRKSRFKAVSACVAVILLFRAYDVTRGADTAASFPPVLPAGAEVVTDTSDAFLKSPIKLADGVTVAKLPPTVEFRYFPGQTYPGAPWSAWGDSVVAGGKYYASIGDHLAIGKGDGAHGVGTGLVFEYDVERKTIRQLVDVAKFLNLPAGHYTPGKIHTRLDLGDDGWLYFATHSGSTTVATETNHYKGDWILRCDPKTGRTQVVAHGPVPKHSIPCGVLDPKRLIFYGGTDPAADPKETAGHFFAYDVKNRKLLCSEPGGPARYLILARSTGRVYYVSERGDENMTGPLYRYDPEVGGAPVKIDATLGLRAATDETPQGFVYTVSMGHKADESQLYRFDTKTETAEKLGPAAVGTTAYITSLDADPTGRYLYYVPGAHGDADHDGTPVVQFDTQTNRRKVLAFLHPFYRDKYGMALKGTYSLAVDERGERLFITWNVSRGAEPWDCCAMTVIHVPDSERR